MTELTFDLAKNNLINFINNLKSVNIHFMYFRYSDDFKPAITYNLRKWVVGEKPYYICNNLTQNKDWCYIYIGSNFKRLINLKDFDIHGYKGKELANIVQGGNDDEIEVEIGNHFTFGLLRQKDGKILIKTHYTYYDEEDEYPFNFTRNENTCNFILQGKINKDTICERKGKPNDPLNTLYRQYGNNNNIIVSLINQYILQNGISGGAKKNYHIYNGYKYLIKIGNKGGKYIELKNNNRHYINKKQKGGADIKITDDFIEFLRINIFLPIKVAKPSLESIQLIYDQDCEFGDNSQIVILYHYRTSLYRFFLDAQKAYNAFISTQTLNEHIPQKIYNDFINEFNTISIPLIIGEA